MCVYVCVWTSVPLAWIQNKTPVGWRCSKHIPNHTYNQPIYIQYNFDWMLFIYSFRNERTSCETMKLKPHTDQYSALFSLSHTHTYTVHPIVDGCSRGVNTPLNGLEQCTVCLYEIWRRRVHPAKSAAQKTRCDARGVDFLWGFANIVFFQHSFCYLLAILIAEQKARGTQYTLGLLQVCISQHCLFANIFYSDA